MPPQPAGDGSPQQAEYPAGRGRGAIAGTVPFPCTGAPADYKNPTLLCGCGGFEIRLIQQLEHASGGWSIVDRDLVAKSVSRAPAPLAPAGGCKVAGEPACEKSPLH
jgi:hypothetical protein